MKTETMGSKKLSSLVCQGNQSVELLYSSLVQLLIQVSWNQLNKDADLDEASNNKKPNRTKQLQKEQQIL